MTSVTEMDARGNHPQQIDSTGTGIADPSMMDILVANGVHVHVADIDRNEYNMEHENRGKALIINNINFEGSTSLSDRRGSDKDASAIYQSLESLGFDTDLVNDATYDEIMIAMRKVSEYDHSSSDCFVCAILSHGDKDGVWATDRQLEVHALMEKVNSRNCPSLIFKPKIFIVQACRGTTLDAGVEAMVDHDRTVSDALGDATEYTEAQIPIADTVRLPSDMDFLVLYSSFEGRGAFRNTENGSPFVNYLVEALEKMDENDDFYQVLTRMNKKMAIEFSPVGTNPEYRHMKQMPCFLSMLTKTLKFKSK